MLTGELLEKIGFEAEDIQFIIDKYKKYRDQILSIAKEYVDGLNTDPYVPYEGRGRSASLQRTNLYITQMQESICDENEYVLNLLFWLACVPYLYDIYKKYEIDQDIFYESMKDFSYKVKECKDVYGVCGVFVNWFFLFFDLKEFSMGRLQYEVFPFGYEEYTCGNVSLKKGDTVYSCHIPSSGKLTYDLCMDSFQKAYEFFKPNLSGDIIPIVSDTWILYKPYIEQVYPKGSNLKQFAELFDVINCYQVGDDFPDAWRVFHQMYDGNTEKLPADTTLRRNFIKYINGGGDFGYGYGIILYDGKMKKIINC